jgi:hypothetical protein
MVQKDAREENAFTYGECNAALGIGTGGSSVVPTKSPVGFALNTGECVDSLLEETPTGTNNVTINREQVSALTFFYGIRAKSMELLKSFLRFYKKVHQSQLLPARQPY